MSEIEQASAKHRVLTAVEGFLESADLIVPDHAWVEIAKALPPGLENIDRFSFYCIIASGALTLRELPAEDEEKFFAPETE